MKGKRRRRRKACSGLYAFFFIFKLWAEATLFFLALLWLCILSQQWIKQQIYIFFLKKSLRGKDYFFFLVQGSGILFHCAREGMAVGRVPSVMGKVMKWCPRNREKRSGTLKGPCLAACVSQSPAPQSFVAVQNMSLCGNILHPNHSNLCV